MSKESAAHREHNSDSISEITENTNHSSCSIASSLDISTVPSLTDNSASVIRDETSHSNRTESVRSLWATASISSLARDSVKSVESLLPDGTSPFIYDGDAVRYNTKDGVKSKAALIIGCNETSVPHNAALVVNGDAIIRKNLKVEGNIDAQSITTTNLFSQNATFENLVASGTTLIIQNSRYLEGTGGATGSNFVVLPTNAPNIIYANPVNGAVNIFLGTGGNADFPSNSVITVKDVTLEVSRSSSRNVNITVPNGVRIEHYNNGLTIRNGGTYTINTAGGAVTLRFVRLPIPGSMPAWVIQDQFIGAQRLIGLAGVTFIPADDVVKAKLLNQK